jgi:hypothetical protein
MGSLVHLKFWVVPPTSTHDQPLFTFCPTQVGKKKKLVLTNQQQAILWLSNSPFESRLFTRKRKLKIKSDYESDSWLRTFFTFSSSQKNFRFDEFSESKCWKGRLYFFKGIKNVVLGEKLRCSRAKPKTVVLGDVKIYGRNRQYDDLGATRERSESRDSTSRSKT